MRSALRPGKGDVSRLISVGVFPATVKYSSRSTLYGMGWRGKSSGRWTLQASAVIKIFDLDVEK